MIELKPGDVCTYSFSEKNRSCAVVEIVRILNDTRGVAEVRFLEVIVDDTGNGFFNYLQRTGGTMNASFKYLKKYKEVSWCEDCRFFESDGIDGEGECKAEHPETDVWYGRPACAAFEPKEQEG